jgi:hypothetical protein
MPVLRSLRPPSGAARLQAFRIQAYLIEAHGLSVVAIGQRWPQSDFQRGRPRIGNVIVQKT